MGGCFSVLCGGFNPISWCTPVLATCLGSCFGQVLTGLCGSTIDFFGNVNVGAIYLSVFVGVFITTAVVGSTSSFEGLPEFTCFSHIDKISSSDFDSGSREMAMSCDEDVLLLRGSIAISLFYAILLSLTTIPSLAETIHKRFWLGKIFILACTITISIFVQPTIITAYGYMCIIVGIVYACYQSTIIVDVACSIAKIATREESPGGVEAGAGAAACLFWVIFIPTCSLSALLYGIAYISHISCGPSSAINATIAVFLLLASIVAGLFSVAERFQERRGTGGLLAASFLVAYTGYLFVDAVSIEPEAWLGTCRQEQRGWWILAVGIGILLLALVHDMVLAVEKEKREDVNVMRWDIMQKHLTTVGASMYAVTIAVGWKTFSYVNVHGVNGFTTAALPTFVFVGEIVVAFVSIGLYIWYVVAPTVFPDRDFGDEDV